MFYALALISNASTTDNQHLRQKQAAALLEPLFIGVLRSVRGFHII